MNRSRNRHIPLSYCAPLAVAAFVFLVPAPTRAAKDPGAATSIQSAPKAPTAPQAVVGPGLWHVVDASTDPALRPGILNGQRSLWCGAYNPCWVQPVGYPNLAYEILYIDTGAHSGSYTLSFKMNFSAEIFYDYLYLVVSTGGTVDPIGANSNALDVAIATGSTVNAVRFASWTGTITSSTPGATAPMGDISGANSGQPETITATISLASGNRALYFVLRSDCIYSNEDGIWPWGTGTLFDDFATSDNGTIYADALAAGGVDAFGGAVIVGTPGAPIVSSRARSKNNPNPPVINAPMNQTHFEGESISLVATASDPDAGDQVSMGAGGYPAGLSLATSNGNPASATLSGSIACGAAAQSTYTIHWCALSPLYQVTAATVLTVMRDPHAPVVTSPPDVRRAIGSTVLVFPTASDPDGDAISSLTANLSALPVGNDASFAAEPGLKAGKFTWHPVTGNEGDYPVSFMASNTLSGCMTTWIHIVSPSATGVSADAQIPPALTLGDCRPNPFNPETTIPFTLPRETRALIQVFDVQGRRVATLADRVVSAGPHETTWDGRDSAGRQAPTGVYLCRLEAAGMVRSRRLVMLR